MQAYGAAAEVKSKGVLSSLFIVEQGGRFVISFR